MVRPKVRSDQQTRDIGEPFTKNTILRNADGPSAPPGLGFATVRFYALPATHYSLLNTPSKAQL